jgi:hypothetical protein
MNDVPRGQQDAPGSEDSLSKAAAAGPQIDWDDEDQTPDAPSRTVAANEADPLHSIYGNPPTDGRQGD